MNLNPILWGLAAGGGARATSPAGEVIGAVQQRQAERAANLVRELEQRLEKLTLVSMAVWSLVQEKTDLTEDDLLARVREIDLMDGQEDGKAKKQLAKCPDCGRTMSPRHNRCLYCGAENLAYSAFDATR